ncbi:hypothetical protein GCM10017044_05470 [Kordiimonas sediminis]|uniref:Class I SAM-dependent methyltransferase n=1 Tax=Kordiimonas sediminis TaxID=1735581 RepID=A0A919ALV6_9PROT|nr:class I SAM-dependent methyltransferase [Kordiimonas sediminis]GHF14283.1 hypothetical protein GCM10017044_05470 [Kordiimonas sediminis]
MHKTDFEILSDLGPSLPGKNWIPAPRYSLRRARILKIIAPFVPGKCLDIGCGPGALLYEMNQQGWQTNGLEISENAHEAGAVLHAETSTKIHKEPIPQWDTTFDLILALDVVEHIEDDHAAVESWRHWLKDGGRVIFSVPAHPSWWNDRDVAAGHFRRYTPKTLSALLEKCGYEVEHIEYFGFPIATLIEFVRFGPLTRFLRRLTGSKGSANIQRSVSQEIEDRTKESGTNREDIMKFYPIVRLWIYQKTIKFFSVIQRLPILSRLGNGLIIVARKRA